MKRVLCCMCLFLALVFDLFISVFQFCCLYPCPWASSSCPWTTSPCTRPRTISPCSWTKHFVTSLATCLFDQLPVQGCLQGGSDPVQGCLQGGSDSWSTPQLPVWTLLCVISSYCISSLFFWIYDELELRWIYCDNYCIFMTKLVQCWLLGKFFETAGSSVDAGSCGHC